MERHGLSADIAAQRIQRMATTEGVAVEELAARLAHERSAGRQRRSSR
jgi:hypothetical protein